ncbi:MAG: hypothetical protein NC089_06700 [Bacteroides sp.]|nr:hypothetical protein [Bacteroides sp.]MCM1549270.1 hypothetical protein [Clostridium sp.]
MKQRKTIFSVVLILAGIGILIRGMIGFIHFADYYGNTWSMNPVTFLVYMAPYLLAVLFVAGIIYMILRPKKNKEEK